MASVEFHEAVVYALSCVDRQDLTLTVEPKQEQALVVVVHCRTGVFAWFPAGYGKSSCYQLLAFVYDVELKWTRSRGTERNIVFCAIAGVDQVVRILTPYEARSRSLVINLRYNKRTRTITRAMNTRPFPPPPRHN